MEPGILVWFLYIIGLHNVKRKRLLSLLLSWGNLNTLPFTSVSMHTWPLSLCVHLSHSTCILCFTLMTKDVVLTL